MTFTHALSTNNYGTAKFIVSSSAANGTHTTIQSAITAASSGDTIFIRPGTYTENLALKAGVNLTAFLGDGNPSTANVNVVGKMTYSSAGAVSISNIHFQTNSDFILVVSGSAASVVTFQYCYFNITNNTAISFTSSSASSIIGLSNCAGDIGTTGITLIVSTASGTFSVGGGGFSNSGNSTTVSSSSVAGIICENLTILVYFSFTGTGFGRFSNCMMGTTSINATCITVNTNTNFTYAWYCQFFSGTATALVVTAGTLNMQYCQVETSNAAAISGAGTLQWGGTIFTGTSSAVTVTTQTPYPLREKQGGTAQSTYATGDILYASATNTLSKLAAGSNGTVLNLQSGVPVWGSQVAFSAYLASNDNNVTGDGTTYTIGTNVAFTEIFDVGGNFNTNGTFTAPVTGKYYISYFISVAELSAAMTEGFITINSSNRGYTTNTGNYAAMRGVTTNIFRNCTCTLVDMDAADTVTFQVNVANGAKTADIQGTGAGVITGVTGYLAA